MRRSATQMAPKTRPVNVPRKSNMDQLADQIKGRWADINKNLHGGGDSSENESSDDDSDDDSDWFNYYIYLSYKLYNYINYPANIT